MTGMERINLRNCELVADGHVHLYPSVAVEALLDAAGRNLSALRAQSSAEPWAGVVIADPQGVNGYERLLRYGHASSTRGRPPWVQDGGGDCSVVFRGASGLRLLVIRGQQLITREGLEVLGAGYTNCIPSGLTLASTVERISAAGGWSTLAWGVAKWWGKRGRLVTDFITAEGGRPGILLGDNGGRPWWWTRVPQFELAAERGMRILAGTDPLPLRGEEARVGSYGFRIEVDRAGRQPVTDALRDALENPRMEVTTIGRRVGAGRFVSNQLGLRLNRLYRKNAFA